MVLMFLARKQMLISQRYDVELKITELEQKITDLLTYASNISDGSISLSEIAGAPGSVFDRQLAFLNVSHNLALQGAQTQIDSAGFQAMLQTQMQSMDATAQEQQKNWIFQQFYKQQREYMAKQEEKLLNQQEKQLQQQKVKLEAQLKMYNQEIESLDQALPKDISYWKPDFGSN